MTRTRLSALAFWFSLVLPSSFVVTKYAGWTGMALYAVVTAIGIGVMPALVRRCRDERMRWLTAAAFFGIVVAFAAIYPQVNTHIAGSGSDIDDALNVGVAALLNGRSPYAQTTYLGNVLHHLGGAFVLAAPFVLVGTSAFQNLFWLPVFFLVVRMELGERTMLDLAMSVLVFSPAVMHDVVTGTDYTSNAIYVVVALWWLVRTTHRDLASIVWGVTIASRANFLLLLPMSFAWLRQHAGWGAALRATALTTATVAVLVVPFYVHDPQRFGPLESADRLLRFDALTPHLGTALLIATISVSLGLSATSMDRVALFRNCAAIQLFPVIAALLVSSFAGGDVDMSSARYGAFFGWFALMAIAVDRSMKRHQPVRRQLGHEGQEVGT